MISLDLGDFRCQLLLHVDDIHILENPQSDSRLFAVRFEEWSYSLSKGSRGKEPCLEGFVLA